MQSKNGIFKNPPRYALVGYPLGHTMSPYIHGRLFGFSGREYSYEVLEILPGDLLLRPGLLRDYEGLNVTIPHKLEIIGLLRDVQGRAALYGAVNTVDCRSGTGYNTDADGFLYALSEAGIALGGRTVLCGCGGAARMMAYEAVLAGAELTVAVRESDLPAARTLIAEIREKTGKAAALEELGGLSGEIDLLINATPLGMYPRTEAMPVGENVLARTKAAFDAVYNPRETLLLKTARENGAKTAGGMPMLVYQAVRAHEIWYGAKFRPEEIRALTKDADDYMTRHFQKA